MTDLTPYPDMLEIPMDHEEMWAAIELIRAETDLTRLRDVEYLEKSLLPRVGLNSEPLDQFPTSLHPYIGKGVRSWQYPAQFARYLVWLSQRGIRSYLEIGSRHGGTFIVTREYLNRFHELDAAWAVDIFDSPILREYLAKTPNAHFLHESSRSMACFKLSRSRKWDLALIDGDHSYEGCKADFDLLLNEAGLIAFHDIASPKFCPGTVKMWDELKRYIPETHRQEFTVQYREVVQRHRSGFLGLGVLDFATPASPAPPHSGFADERSRSSPGSG